MTTDDLSALDRTTLRLWRASNLVGWGAVGAVAGIVTFVIAARTLAGLSEQVTNGSPASFVAVIFVAAGIGGVVTGMVIGGRVYRTPGIVAVASLLAPGLLLSLLAIKDHAAAPAIYTLGLPAIGGAVAALVARTAFRRRPRALRAAR